MKDRNRMQSTYDGAMKKSKNGNLSPTTREILRLLASKAENALKTHENKIEPNGFFKEVQQIQVIDDDYYVAKRTVEGGERLSNPELVTRFGDYAMMFCQRLKEASQPASTFKKNEMDEHSTIATKWRVCPDVWKFLAFEIDANLRTQWAIEPVDQGRRARAQTLDADPWRDRQSHGGDWDQRQITRLLDDPVLCTKKLCPALRVNGSKTARRVWQSTRNGAKGYRQYSSSSSGQQQGWSPTLPEYVTELSENMVRIRVCCQWWNLMEAKRKSPRSFGSDSERDKECHTCPQFTRDRIRKKFKSTLPRYQRRLKSWKRWGFKISVILWGVTKVSLATLEMHANSEVDPPNSAQKRILAEHQVYTPKTKRLRNVEAANAVFPFGSSDSDENCLWHCRWEYSVRWRRASPWLRFHGHALPLSLFSMIVSSMYLDSCHSQGQWSSHPQWSASNINTRAKTWVARIQYPLTKCWETTLDAS